MFVLGLTAVVMMAAGFLGLGQAPDYQSAPMVARPFSVTDPDTHTGPATTGPLGPDTLAVPSLGITAPVTTGGLDTGQNAMILPTSDKTAWFTGAAPVGADHGSTVIAGHVNYPDGSPGVLGNLAQISKGAPVYLTDHSGAVHGYKVVSALTLTKTALPSELFRIDGDPQLVLITCGGDIVDTGNGVLGYNHNTVITAVPV